MALDWREYISNDPAVLTGKPVLRGTRLSVAFVLQLFASGWTEQQVIENYPAVTPESIRAVFAFAAQALNKGPARVGPEA
jgi:uncharacterized protein (DUF433 family)